MRRMMAVPVTETGDQAKRGSGSRHRRPNLPPERRRAAEICPVEVAFAGRGR